MSLTVTIIAKLSGVDAATARRALDTVTAFDEPQADPPAEFSHGAHARAFAFATIAEFRPAFFWIGIIAVAAIPVLLVVKVLHHG